MVLILASPRRRARPRTPDTRHLIPVMPLVAVIPTPRSAVELRELPAPDLEPDSALLDVELSEVCGTDVYLQQGRLEGVPLSADSRPRFSRPSEQDSRRTAGR